MHQRILKNKMYHGFHKKYEAVQLFSAANQQMISEGSCDTEDWSNDAENTALHHKNKLHFTIYSHGTQNVNNISQFLVFFDQINASLVSRRDFFQKLLYSFQMVLKVFTYFIVHQVIIMQLRCRNHLFLVAENLMPGVVQITNPKYEQ